ncbi:MAG: hypothetical protein Q8830_02440 [Candidatus Phytoplasma australasiaticum]|nr:hypothetical protein [Candidatus Phytoplasma australasiaticum]
MFNYIIYLNKKRPPQKGLLYLRKENYFYIDNIFSYCHYLKYI